MSKVKTSQRDVMNCETQKTPNPKPKTDSEDLTSPGPILSNLDLT